jgi:hypothetical protein
MCKLLIRSVFFVLLLCLAVDVTNADLVAYWPMDEGAGTTIGDYTGAWDGTMTGDVAWVQGHQGTALEFPGGENYVNCGNVEIGPSLTLAYWCFNPQKAFERPIGQHSGNYTADPGWAVYSRDEGEGGVWFRVHGADNAWDGGDIIISDNLPKTEWFHLTFTFDGPTRELKGYLNGEEKVSKICEAGRSIHPNTNDLRLGNVGTGEVYTGMLDEIAVWDEALDVDEIEAVMLGHLGGPQPLAFGPAPKNGTLLEQTSVMLQWKPGDFATSHRVYFGESLEAVGGGQLEPVSTAATILANSLIPGYAAGLTPGVTYYWRVDEVNDVHPDSPWKGDVWSFRVRPVIAWEPSPADGIHYVPVDPDLAWKSGTGALFHTVYFGESSQEVDEMVIGGWMTTEATYSPGLLEADKTYYWRVDEFSTTGTTHKGEVWSFTTVPEVAVTDPTLVGWWTLDEGSGGTAVDWSGHGNHGALIGDPQWVDGYLGGALDFDGNDHVDTGNTTDLVTWTVAAWAISPDAPSGGAASGPVHREKNYQIDWNHANEVFRGAAAVRVGGADGAWHAASFGPLQGNTWYHLAATFDGTALTSYKNGVLMVSNTAAAGTPDPETGTLLIGRHSTSSGNYFTGTVDDVRVYDRALAEDEIKQVMRGNPLLAGSPNPGPGAVVDIRDATALSWVAGDTAVSHDVYFGTDRNGVAAADKDAAEYQGNQPGTSFALTGLVELGGGDYYWRIDEVEGAGSVQTGYVWKFTVPDYLIVDDFESYSNEVGHRVFEAWIDGAGFTQPVETPGNGSGALVGHDIWTGGYTSLMETDNVYDGSQAMPIYYDNTVAPGYSQADRTFAPPQNWTVEGVTTLVVHVRGEAGNTGQLYVEINGVRYDAGAPDVASPTWVAWEIDLASIGVTLTNITQLSIGVEGGGAGVLYVDAIRLVRP